MKFSNKKKIILGSIIGVLIGTLMSVSYAFFTYANTSGTTNQLITGDIYLKYGETSALGINGAMPSSTYPSASTGNYFQFQITGKNTHETGSVLYKLKLAYGDNTTDRLNRIDDKYLYFKLVEVSENTEKIVVNDANFTTIPNSTLYVDTIPSNTTTEITKTYRLYMRIGEEVGIGTNTTYTQDKWNKLYASVKVNAEGNYITGDLASKKIISRYNGSGQDGLVAVNTNGDLYTGTGEIREYRYSGSGRYCIYTDGETTYHLQIESGNTCPESATYGSLMGKTRLWSPTTDPIASPWGITISSGTTYNLSKTNSTVQEDNTVKNYVTFNNEMWRIVGIVDGNIKLVKNTPLTSVPDTNYTNLNGDTFILKPGQPGGLKYPWYYWNKPTAGTEKNNWANAGTMYYLNENQSGSYYYTIDANYKGLVADATYYLGNAYAWGNAGTAKDVYIQERSSIMCASSVTSNSYNNNCNVWNGNQATWTGKIAMLNVSDFGYAASSDMWSINIGSYYNGGTSRIFEKNWLLATDAYYTSFLSPSYESPQHGMKWFETGEVSSGYVGSSSNAVRPVLNLKSDTLIISGDGSYNNPYRLQSA